MLQYAFHLAVYILIFSHGRTDLSVTVWHAFCNILVSYVECMFLILLYCSSEKSLKYAGFVYLVMVTISMENVTSCTGAVVVN